MICFDVFRNGDRLCRAGVGEEGVLSATLSWVAPKPHQSGPDGELQLAIGGLRQPEPGVNTHLTWPGHADLRPGDEVTIRVVEAAAADEPRSEERTTEAEVEEQQRRYYEILKQQFGDGET